MSKGDQAVDTAADKLEAFVRGARAGGGVKAKLADALADDPDFLRKLKPSLISARAKGNAPTDEPPGAPRHAPSGPLLARPETSKKERSASTSSGGVSPWAVVGIALVAGYLLAKTIDWRGHAHPRS